MNSAAKAPAATKVAAMVDVTWLRKDMPGFLPVDF
jgi:hypothetical protein